MHVVFIPYGCRHAVEVLLRDMEAQKFYMLFNTKEGKPTGKGVNINGRIRQLPFGLYEYVFPKEHADAVLYTLDFDKNRYEIPKLILKLIKKVIKCEDTPEYKKSQYYLWIKDYVNIIPIGVRYDADIYDDVIKQYHEAL